MEGRSTRRRRARFAALITAITATAALGSASDDGGSTAFATRTLHVATTGDDTNSGTAAAPLRTLEEAVRQAASGDTIELAPGTYNESVQIFEKEVHIRSSADGRAVLDGARPITGFVADDNAWYLDGWTTEFDVNVGPMVYEDHPIAGAPDQVFVNGQALRQVERRSRVANGTFFHDTVGDRLWIGTNPTGKLVEASTLSWGLYFNRADGSSLTDVTVRRYATEFHHEGAVRGYADRLRFDGVIAEDNAYIGLSLIGDDIRVRNGRFLDNGYIGLHGDSLSNVVVSDAVIAGNNREGFNSHHSAAGLKFTNASSVVISGSDVQRNDGPGLWTDIESSGITITRNFITKNQRSGIQIELTENVTIADNVSTRNLEAGVWVLESQSVNVWHNTVLDNRHEVYVLEGPRDDVTSVSIRNNLLGDASPTPFPILTVNDWTHRQPASAMNVSSDHNLYWRRTADVSTYVSWWGRWPEPWAEHTTVAEQVATVGQGASSNDRVGSALPVRDSSAFDYRGDASVPLGAPLTASVAASLGETPGDRLRIGPVNPSPDLGVSVPINHEGLTIDGTAGGSLSQAVRIG